MAWCGKLTLDDHFLVELPDRRPDHPKAPEALALLALLEILDFFSQVVQHVEEVWVPVFLSCAPVGRVKGSAAIDPEDAVIEEGLAHHPDELAEDGLVEYQRPQDGEAGHELSPDLVRALVVREVLRLGDGHARANPLHEACLTAIRKAVCDRFD